MISEKKNNLYSQTEILNMISEKKNNLYSQTEIQNKQSGKKNNLIQYELNSVKAIY
jgi:hypothetical protein